MKLGIPVAELLERLSSDELAEWIAYERYAGPSEMWTAEVLAQIHELLQQIAYCVGAQVKAQLPRPKRYPRPHESVSWAERRRNHEAEPAKTKSEVIESLNAALDRREAKNESG
ncbi:hypothetical protein GCM10012275_28220 [Longimycelium tulufanense]|uniref:Uncharacterized protein n=1 Tax=Longimycelium tulufanense TaxID=907463 RepID=A0A8J3C8N8_9PSEU|nr:hypothetical protein GCM10012275_28220 [Longimycelium tulufanense]